MGRSLDTTKPQQGEKDTRRTGSDLTLHPPSRRVQTGATGLLGPRFNFGQISILPPGPIVQPKLRVGAASTGAEQEADRIADQVVRDQSPDPQTVPAPPRLIQRSGGGEGFPTPPQFQQDLGSSQGQALDPDLQQEMEGKLGEDLSQVRLHTGTLPSRLNDQIGARAFTYGSDIYFGQGEYDPDSSGGKRLLAHELVHTLQQGSQPTLIQRTAKDAVFKAEALLGIVINEQYLDNDADYKAFRKKYMPALKKLQRWQMVKEIWRSAEKNDWKKLDKADLAKYDTIYEENDLDLDNKNSNNNSNNNNKSLKEAQGAFDDFGNDFFNNNNSNEEDDVIDEYKPDDPDEDYMNNVHQYNQNIANKPQRHMKKQSTLHKLSAWWNPQKQEQINQDEVDEEEVMDADVSTALAKRDKDIRTALAKDDPIAVMKIADDVYKKLLPKHEDDKEEIKARIDLMLYMRYDHHLQGSAFHDDVEDSDKIDNKASSNKLKSRTATVSHWLTSTTDTVVNAASTVDTFLGGPLKLITIMRSGRVAVKAKKRTAACNRFMELYYRPEDPNKQAKQDLLSDDNNEIDQDNLMLGEIAAYAAGKSETLGRRNWTRVAGAVIGIAGIPATVFVPPLGIAMMVGGGLIAAQPTAETISKKYVKEHNESKGWNRGHYATALWRLGQYGHEPSLKFMQEIGILDAEGEMIEAGFFDSKNRDISIEYIMWKLRSG